MNDILKKFLGSKSVAKNLEGMFSDNYVSAKKAYMMARHGKLCTQVDLLKNFLADLRSLIESKSSQNEYMCIKHVEEDIVELLPYITEYLTNKLGYKCIVIDPHTSIINKVKTQEVKSDVKINTTILILFWDEVDISEHLFENETPGETTDASQDILAISDTHTDSNLEEHE
jgi:hypothetical protein